jgi:nicotinamide mononucleotide adenylyltransferase
MGGLAGHISHLYENPSLTFKEIKDIFKKISDGKMLVTEKTDGQNLFLSFSVIDNKARTARNQKNIIEGGIKLENLSNLIESKQAQDSFYEAVKMFEETVSKFPIEEQMEIFGPNANYYYNCEIQDPKNCNVLNYDNRLINFHRSGHLKFNKFNQKVVQEVLGSQFLKLEKLLKENSQINEQVSDGFIVRTNEIRQLKPLADKNHYQNSLKRLQNEINTHRMSDSGSLAEYVLNRLDKILENKIPELPKSTKMQLIKKLMKVDGVSSRDVYLSLNKNNCSHLTEKLKLVLDSEKSLLKEAIVPIEEIVTEFSTGVLKEFQSSYIKESDKEIQRLKNKLSEIFDIVGNSGDLQAQNFLNKQFNKIKDINNINSSCEGFVFKYNDNLYKMTGLFSPLNQILGMTKYKRGNMQPIKVLNVANENKTAIVSFGRFNPPTIGHEVVFKMGSELAKQTKADFFIVPTKTNDKQKNPLTLEEKISYISKIFPEYNSNILNNTNINTIFDTAKYLSERGYKNFKVIVGSDRKQQFEVLNKYNKDYNFSSIEIISAGERLDEGEGIEAVSASKARQSAVDGDVESFMKNFAGRLELEEGIKLMNLIRSRIEIVEDNKKKVLEPLSPSLLNEYIKKSGNKWCVFSKKKTKEGKRKKLGCYNSRTGAKNRLRQVEYFKSIKEDKELQEMNAGSTGAVQGTAAAKNKNPWNEREVVYLEEDDVEESASNVFYPRDMETRFGTSSKRDDEPSRKDVIKILIMQEEQFMINRKEFIEEIKLRKIIREGLKRKMKEREEKILQEEKQLRLVIRKLLQEKEEETPHKITGINILKDLLKKIVPTMEKDYKNLTTNKKQRDSYRAHILNATKNLFTVSDSPDEHIDVDVKQKELEEEADPSEPNDPKFIRVRPKQTVAAPEEVDTFTIAGLDTTGRDQAQKTMKRVQKQIEDAYDGLSDEKDKEAFRDYLLTNQKLHMDIFENELNVNVEEPTTPEYEKEKEKLDANPPEQAGEEAPPPEGDVTSQLPSSNPEQAPPVSPNPEPQQPVMERRKR